MSKTQLKTAPARRPCFFAEFKALDATAGTFEGYLSVFGNTDSYNDVVDPGSFAKTLGEAEARRAQAPDNPYLYPILWQHNPYEPIGGFTEAREDARGLYVKGTLDLDIPEGRRAYSAMSKGYVRGMSIGYIAINERWDRDVRHLTEIKLLEGSVVTFPANPLATIDGVKDAFGNVVEACPACGFGLAHLHDAEAVKAYRAEYDAKAGRRFSAANASHIRDSIANVRQVLDSLQALVDESEPGQDDTTDDTPTDAPPATDGKGAQTPQGESQPGAQDTTHDGTDSKQDDMSAADAERIWALVAAMRIDNARKAARTRTSGN